MLNCSRNSSRVHGNGAGGHGGADDSFLSHRSLLLDSTQEDEEVLKSNDKSSKKEQEEASAALLHRIVEAAAFADQPADADDHGAAKLQAWATDQRIDDLVTLFTRRLWARFIRPHVRELVRFKFDTLDRDSIQVELIFTEQVEDEDIHDEV